MVEVSVIHDHRVQCFNPMVELMVAMNGRGGTPVGCVRL